MSISLPRFANGDTDYVAKLNQSASTIESAISSIESQLTGAASATVSFGAAMPALFGPSTAVLQPGLVATGASTTLTVTSGYAWLPSSLLVVSSSGASLSFSGLGAATYYVDIDTSGVLTRVASSGANTLWSVGWNGTAFTTIARVAPVIFTNSQPVDLPVWVAGKPTASERILRFIATRSVTFPASLTGSYGTSRVASTAQRDFDLQKNGVSAGTVRFAAAGTTASFIAASPIALAAGDLLEVIAPGTQDATLEDIAFTLVGTR
jgi:hypothetical protein